MTTPTAGGSAGGESGGSQTTETNAGGNGAAGGQGGGDNREERRFSELTSKLNAKDAQIQELTGKLTEFETKFRQQTDATDTAKGELSKVVERLEGDNKSLKSKLDEAHGKIATLEVDAFERSLLDEIQTDATVKPGLVRGAYREMLASRKLDRMPKDGDAKAIAKERKKLLAEDFPELFEAREQPRGGSPHVGQGGEGRGRSRLTL